jgi:hypothetical protein
MKKQDRLWPRGRGYAMALPAWCGEIDYFLIRRALWGRVLHELREFPRVRLGTLPKGLSPER